MNKFAESVAADNARELERNRNSWLQRNVKFNAQLRLPPARRILIARLFRDLTGGEVRKINQRVFDLEVLIANLLTTKKPISISLNNNHWKSSRYSKLSYFVRDLVKLLHRGGLIGMAKGYHTEKGSRNTRIWRTDELLKHCHILPREVIYEPVELVELRELKTKKLKEYSDTAYTIRVRKILQKVNAVNDAAEIRHGHHKLKPFLRAIFKGKFTLYGRLHTQGYRHYQGLGEDKRAEITINGEPVAELDYSGYQPRLLYAAEGIQYNLDPYLEAHSDPRARDFLKTILLAMLNAKNRRSAEAAANNWLFKHRTERKELKEIGITHARPLMEAFEKAHQPISKYFCKGKDTGLRLMNKDATIALEVVKNFADDGIPVLAIHDSFLVQRRHITRLHKAMAQAYRHQTKGFRCPIK